MTHDVHSYCLDVKSEAYQTYIFLKMRNKFFFKKIGHICTKHGVCNARLEAIGRDIDEYGYSRKKAYNKDRGPDKQIGGISDRQSREAFTELKPLGLFTFTKPLSNSCYEIILTELGKLVYKLIYQKVSLPAEKSELELKKIRRSVCKKSAAPAKKIRRSVDEESAGPNQKIRRSVCENPPGIYIDLTREFTRNYNSEEKIETPPKIEETPRVISEVVVDSFSLPKAEPFPFNPTIEVVESAKPIEVNNIMSKFKDKPQQGYASPVSRHLQRFAQASDDKEPAAIAKVIASLGIVKSDATSYPPEVYDHPLSEYQQRQLAKPSRSVVNYEPGSKRASLYNSYYDKIEKNGIVEHLSPEGKYRLTEAIVTQIDKGKVIYNPETWGIGVCNKLKDEQELNEELKNEQRAIANSSVEATKKEVRSLHDIDTGTLEYRKAVVARNKERWAALGLNVGASRHGA